MKKKKINTKQLSKIFKALSNPNRLTLYFEIMKKNEASYNNCEDCMITDIMTKLKINPPTVSHHLKELENAGLIETERKGKYLIARINKEITKEVEIIFPSLGEKEKLGPR